jgi:hypothetical protein
MNGDDRVLAIVLAAEHLFDLTALHLLVELIQPLRQIAVDRLAGVGPFEQDGEVVAARLELTGQLDILLEATTTLQDALRLGLILPEIRRRSPRFQPIQFVFGFGGFKDSYADRQRGG